MDMLGGFGEAIFIVGVAALCGIVLFLLVGLPLLRRFAERTGNLYTGSDSSIRILPEYSVAEARVKQGKYTEAVEEYRKVVAQYPEDAYPHLRIAELALEHLHDSKLAELELLSAVAKAEGEDTSALAAGRLADFYQQTLHDPQRALEALQRLKEKLAGSKRGRLVEQRIETLEKIVEGYEVQKPPVKIAVKPADEETIRRRRGF
jgi:tetratricopeptide (TPR) repeat protein